MTYKTGSVGEFMTWTKRVITNPTTTDDTPRHWFDNEATAARSLGTTTTPEAMVKLLSEENIGLLRLIVLRHPDRCENWRR